MYKTIKSTPNDEEPKNTGMAHKGTKAKVLTRKVSYPGRLSPHLEQMGLLPAWGRKVITSAGGPESRHRQVS
ncbi:MAG: hypothetical protein PHI97_25865 [Desulfobulbus sp.]|nr:hypothetical protein [Desulfobulbus sp.]